MIITAIVLFILAIVILFMAPLLNLNTILGDKTYSVLTTIGLLILLVAFAFAGVVYLELKEKRKESLEQSQKQLNRPSTQQADSTVQNGVGAAPVKGQGSTPETDKAAPESTSSAGDASPSASTESVRGRNLRLLEGRAPGTGKNQKVIEPSTNKEYIVKEIKWKWGYTEVDLTGKDVTTTLYINRKVKETKNFKGNGSLNDLVVTSASYGFNADMSMSLKVGSYINARSYPRLVFEEVK